MRVSAFNYDFFTVNYDFLTVNYDSCRNVIFPLRMSLLGKDI